MVRKDKVNNTNIFILYCFLMICLNASVSTEKRQIVAVVVSYVMYISIFNIYIHVYIPVLH